MSIRRAGLNQRSRSRNSSCAGLQCPLDASRSGPADRGNGRPIEGGKDLDVLPFGLSPGDQQGKMLCHDTLF